MPTRRDILRNGWKLGGTLLAAAAGWTTYEALRPLAGASTTGPLELGNPADFAPGTATHIRAGRLWVSNADGHFFALSQRCPHLGCGVPFCESSGRFECPCHGSVFDIAGEWIAGPAPRGMDRYELSVGDNGNLVADLSTRVDGPGHGANTFLTPPSGPSCQGA